MASGRLNILVYSGPGSTIESVRHCVYTLRRLLSPTYAVLPVSGPALVSEPWPLTCALLVMPGGADLPYCETLNGVGNRRIRQYVERGGAYLGFCAGGYYASARCEFEVGDKAMEVVGDRELAFYPGVCRGCAFEGFVYHSEVGARAVDLKVNRAALSEGAVPDVFRSYYNGGGVFVDAPRYKSKGVEVLASFVQTVAVDAGDGAAAVVHCKVGDGAAILTSPHPEFAAVNLDPSAGTPEFPKVIEALKGDDELRTNFLKACLSKLGLRVNQETSKLPSLSRLHLTSTVPSGTSVIMDALKDILSAEAGERYLKDENDTFHFQKPSAWSLSSLEDSLPDPSSENPSTTTSQGSVREEGERKVVSSSLPSGDEDRILDYSTVVKCVAVHESDFPNSKETPYFNHGAFYANLRHYYSQPSSPKGADSAFGGHLLYGEVVTSTNTILEKNTQLLRRLPHGLTFAATIQVAGRGRGSNVWVSPAGSLMFSTVIRHPVALTPRAPVVFLQYLAALAVVEGVRTYDRGYESVSVRLKWPNDIYTLDPHAGPSVRDNNRFTKIGGILVNSHYSSTDYFCVVGLGLNLSNAAPTTSLNQVLAASHPHLAPFTPEKLLARILSTFARLYAVFREKGWCDELDTIYDNSWLHSGQVVDVEGDVVGGTGVGGQGTRVRVLGISRDWGLLVGEEVDEDGRGTGRRVQLQSDGNSFDFFSGLVKRKV